MNLIKHFLTSIFLCATLLASGQTTTANTNEPPYIEVNGTAEQEVIPDEIYIAIVIRERYAGRDKITIEAQEEKLKTAVASLGINAENLTLTDANAGYVKVYWWTKDVLTKKDYTLKVSDAATVGKVLKELEKLEITDAHISRVNHTKLDSLRKAVKIMAIKAAKDKADYLLAAIGEQTGKPLIIRENEISPHRPLGRVNIRGGRADGLETFVDGLRVQENNEIQFEKIKIQTSIYVKFSIK